jgi:hypothetical protein
LEEKGLVACRFLPAAKDSTSEDTLGFQGGQEIVMPQPSGLMQRRPSLASFKDPRLTFSVSARRIRQDIDIVDYLRIFFIYCDLRHVESVFGTTTLFSKLYGGRPAVFRHDLTENHLARLAEFGIGLSLPLSNHFFADTAYRESWPLLERNHVKGNSIICTNDRLAVRLRRDFPLYELRASVIKRLDTVAKIKRALTLYDTVTLPMEKTGDTRFLASIPEKQRVVLFGNANCACTCATRTCFLGFSQRNFGKPVTFTCPEARAEHLDRSHIFFDINRMAEIGFTRFNLVPAANIGSIEACRKLSWTKGYLTASVKKDVHYLCSHPKCGRTWLQHILAHYINRRYHLGMTIDLTSLSSLMPNSHSDSLTGVNTYRYGGDRRFPLLVASHASYSVCQFGQDEASRIVFLFRSIPDVVVSNYFHRSRFVKWFDGGLKDFIRAPRGGLVAYCNYLNSWAPAVESGRPWALTYEELSRDTEKAVSAVLTLLQIPLGPGLLHDAVQSSTFAAMQAVERERGVPRSEASPDDPEGRRVRQGKVGGSRKYLDQEDLDYIDRTSDTLLSDSAKALLARHHLWPRQGRD